ncbi:MAG: hypothetical protein OEW39_15320 [Deltaproteobacteria bacterium]|nr:hypothetical protein [Deltaproteobacteria bacterium]
MGPIEKTCRVGVLSLALMLIAGGAQAQLKTEVDVSATFGRVTLETARGPSTKTSTSEFMAVERVELALSGGVGDFSSRVRLLTEDRYDRFGANPGVVMDVQFLGHELTWKANKEVSVTLSGNSLGVASLDPKSGMNLFHGVIAPNTATYDDEGYAGQGRGYGLINLEYAMDKNTVVGLAVFTDCISGFCDALLGPPPARGAGGGGGPVAITPNAERQTKVVHGRKALDTMDFSAGYIMGSGIVRNAPAADITIDTKGFQVGGTLKTKEYTAGLDYMSNTTRYPTPKPLGMEDQSLSAFSLGLEMNAIHAVYFSGKVNNVGGIKNAAISSSSIVVGYGVPVGKTGTIGGEYRTESIAVTGLAKTTDTSIAFGMKSRF